MKYRLQFGIKWLFLALTICALICAVVWHWWPAYQDYVERQRFESLALKLTPGITAHEVNRAAPPANMTRFSGGDNVRAVKPVLFRGAWYCIYLKLEKNTGGEGRIAGNIPSTAVELYRVQPVPMLKDGVDPEDALLDEFRKSVLFPSYSQDKQHDSPRSIKLHDVYSRR